MSAAVTPFSLKDAPTLIERLLPVQKLSAEAFKEQMAGSSKTLTGLGSYWKGRKPLILNKACILGCLLPATSNPVRDLEIFEMLMGMDIKSLEKRLEEKKSKECRYILSQHTSVGHHAPYRDWIDVACRPEECGDELFSHVWEKVNAHVGTAAGSIPELVEQLGIMRFGHRPRIADTFCGSGQIPFEAARLGCDVFASDLNPVACMLTWGAINIIGSTLENRIQLTTEQNELIRLVQHEIDRLGVETDGKGWRAKVFLYCVEARCPQSGWMVPLLPTLVVSTGYRVVAELVPDVENRRYQIKIRSGVTEKEMKEAEKGTIVRENKFGEASVMHEVNGVTYKTKITTLRGDYQNPDGTVSNKLRLWERTDFKPRPEDIFQERLYCVQWMRHKNSGKGYEFEFRNVSDDDLARELVVEGYIAKNLVDWQSKGWLPDMRIEVGSPPRYQGQDLVRARGWMYWHHVFNARQLLIAGLFRRYLKSATSATLLMRALNINARLSVWHRSHGGGGSVQQVFSNQALNTLYDYGSRASEYLAPVLQIEGLKNFPVQSMSIVQNQPANQVDQPTDIFITDPPYGDAVKYEEILDFFIAWLRTNPPSEFADWVWDSRRSLAIQGEGEDFRRGMVAAYRRMTECMIDNGIQIVMFTHQSGSIWADMANIVWASGLHVTAAWYVVTETDNPLREGSNVKGTVLLVLRKRQGTHKTTRDDLAWEIQEEVESQVKSLTGLNQEAKGLYRDENVFEDADIQMAGYAAALRVLTRYAVIDGRDMAAEAIRPRVKGETTFVDGLIAFAVDTANQCLVPQGLPKSHWDKLSGAERFYLKLLDMEARGAKTLDNYQNFAKAFKVRDFQALMASKKANAARLKNAVEFGRTEMSEGSELHQSVLRAVLYAIMELVKNIDSAEVLAHLMLNIPDYYGNMTQRDLGVELADYLAKRLESLRPEEATAARVLRELVKNQRLG
jgi:putative DNA methylase